MMLRLPKLTEAVAAQWAIHPISPPKPERHDGGLGQGRGRSSATLANNSGLNLKRRQRRRTRIIEIQRFKRWRKGACHCNQQSFC